MTVELRAELRALNPFDFFLEPSAEHWPFRYDAALAQDLAPYRETTAAGPRLNEFLSSLTRERVRSIDFLVELNQRVQRAVEYVIRMQPGVQDPETTLALGKSLGNGLERVRDEWIGAAIGLNAQRRKLTPVLAKSMRTLKLFQAGMDGLHHLYTAGGLHKAILGTSPAHPGVTVPLNAKLVRNEIETARGEIAKLARQGKPFDADKMMQPLVAVGFPMKNAREQAIALLGLTAGLSMGFNASDGD